MRKGHNFKDYICPDTFEFEKDYFRMGNRYGRVLFLREYASYIKDNMIDRIQEAFAELVKQKLKYRAEPRRSVNTERSCAAEHSHCRKKAEKAEDVIAVDMGKTDMFDLQEGDSGLAHLYLRTFTTVNHKQAPTYIQYLGAWISFSRGQGRSRAQDIKSEIHLITCSRAGS